MTSNSPTSPAIGERMSDGTICAGISPDTGRPMFVTPADAPLTMIWNRAMEYASGLDAHGRHDWRVPTDSELSVMFTNRAAIGGFVTHGLTHESWYWSSKQDYPLRPDIAAIAIRFDTGEKCRDYKFLPSALRCVRG